MNRFTARALLVSALFALCSACAAVGDAGTVAAARGQALSATAGQAAAIGAADNGANPADAFLAELARLCGQAFAGRIVANEPASPDPDPFSGRALVMHVRGCKDPARELRIPFHVGDDRSRTWVVTRSGNQLQLKHDHRHDDGTEDKLSQYGGETILPGTAQRQEFPADQFSKDLFVKEDRAASVTNVWAMEVRAPGFFAYELRRPGRFFRVEFGPAAAR